MFLKPRSKTTQTKCSNSSNSSKEDKVVTYSWTILETKLMITSK